MKRIRCGGRAMMVLAIGVLATARTAQAQAWEYPAFQTPEIASREFNFAVAGASDYGTTGLVQWREGIGPSTHLNFEFGISSPSGSDTRVDVGGGIVQRVLRSSNDVPLDIALTGGLYFSFASGFTLVRLPVGAVVGHRFKLNGGSGNMAVTPYVHPRVSFDFCTSGCDNSVNVDFDVGASLDLSHLIAIRAALLFGPVANGDSKVGFGAGLTFRPGGSRTGTL